MNNDVVISVKNVTKTFKVYFDKVQMKNERAELHLSISFSGMELYIPKGWQDIDAGYCTRQVSRFRELQNGLCTHL